MADKLQVGRMEAKLKSTADAKEKYIRRVKVSSKYLPMNKNLKLKSYITLKYTSYKSVLKKIPSRYSTYKYSSIIQFIARILFGCYKICKGIYIKKGGA